MVVITKRNIVGSSPTEFTLVDYPTMDDRSVMDIKSSDRLKQEVDKEQGLTLFKFQQTVKICIDFLSNKK